MPRLPKDGLGLSFFLSKAKAVRLYRDFLRAAQSLDTEARKHAVQHVRTRFEENRHLRDPQKIKDCMAIGAQQLGILRRQVGFASTRLTAESMDTAWGDAFGKEGSNHADSASEMGNDSDNNSSAVGQGWPWARD